MAKCQRGKISKKNQRVLPIYLFLPIFNCLFLGEKLLVVEGGPKLKFWLTRDGTQTQAKGNMCSSSSPLGLGVILESVYNIL